MSAECYDEQDMILLSNITVSALAYCCHWRRWRDVVWWLVAGRAFVLQKSKSKIWKGYHLERYPFMRVVLSVTTYWMRVPYCWYGVN